MSYEDMMMSGEGMWRKHDHHPPTYRAISSATFLRAKWENQTPMELGGGRCVEGMEVSQWKERLRAEKRRSSHQSRDH